jgi:hypothetical protein
LSDVGQGLLSDVAPGFSPAVIVSFVRQGLLSDVAPGFSPAVIVSFLGQGFSPAMLEAMA